MREYVEIPSYIVINKILAFIDKEILEYKEDIGDNVDENKLLQCSIDTLYDVQAFIYEVDTRSVK